MDRWTRSDGGRGRARAGVGAGAGEGAHERERKLSIWEILTDGLTDGGRATWVTVEKESEFCIDTQV